eukprot:Pgem_evm1s16045
MKSNFSISITHNKTLYDNETINGLLKCQCATEVEYAYIIGFIACRVKLWKHGTIVFRDIVYQNSQTLATNYIMTPGVHNFEFSITLPENMPPTCHDKKNLSVEWFVLSKVVKLSLEDPSGFSRQIIAKEYFRKGSLYVPRPELAPKCEKSKQAGLGKGGNILVNASLSKDVYFRGESVDLEVTLKNSAKSMEVTAINCSIEQRLFSEVKMKKENRRIIVQSTSVVDSVKSLKNMPVKAGDFTTIDILTTPRFHNAEHSTPPVVVPGKLVDSVESDTEAMAPEPMYNMRSPSCLDPIIDEVESTDAVSAGGMSASGVLENASSEGDTENSNINRRRSSVQIQLQNSSPTGRYSQANNTRSNSESLQGSMSWSALDQPSISGRSNTVSFSNSMRRSTSKFREIVMLQKMISQETGKKGNDNTIALAPSFEFDDPKFELKVVVSYILKVKVKLRGSKSIKFELPFIIGDEAEHDELENNETDNVFGANTLYASSNPLLSLAPPTYSLLHVQSLDCLDFGDLIAGAVAGGGGGGGSDNDNDDVNEPGNLNLPSYEDLTMGMANLSAS